MNVLIYMIHNIFITLLLFLAPNGSFGMYLEKVDTTPFIIIDKNNCTLYLVDSDGNQIKEYGVACAENLGNKEKRGDHKTPEGLFKISQILNSKDLTHDFGDGKGEISGAYGPWFLRLDVRFYNDIGIHGTHLPESIGSRTTEGCIRLRNEDIQDLKSRVRVGTPVIILPDSLQINDAVSVAYHSNDDSFVIEKTQLEKKPDFLHLIRPIVIVLCLLFILLLLIRLFQGKTWHGQ